MTVTAGTPYVRRSFNPNAPGLEGLEWDSAELLKVHYPPHSYSPPPHCTTPYPPQLTATETMNYDDAFTLEGVAEDLVDKFNHVAGIVAVLTTHIHKVSHYDITMTSL